MTVATPKRPLLRWHGGKFRLASWIVANLPPHRVYVEPYGGAASILLHKRRTITEVYNDLDDTLVSLFRLLRDDTSSTRLVQQLRLTPFARTEFLTAYEPCNDPVESARRTIVRSFMGFGSDGTAGVYRTGFRRQQSDCGSTPAREWSNYADALETMIARLSGVTIENEPALKVMAAFDDTGTLHYVDPPYVGSTRSRGSRRKGQGYHVYQHELDDDDHAQMLVFLNGLKGMVALSAYPSALYTDMLRGWTCLHRSARADGNRPRTECLWLNPAAIAAMPCPQLFEQAV